MASEHSTDGWRDLYPFESRWRTLPAGRMHYVDEGPADAPVLLFVHGNPTWSFHWRRLIAALRGEHRCVAMDHLGCGLSDKPQRAFRLEDRVADLTRLVRELDLRHVTLVAQDWGGAIGLGAMQELRERLDGIVLFNTGAFPPWFVPRRIAVCRTPLVGRFALQRLNLFSRAALRMTLSRASALDPAVARGYLAPYDSWANRRAVYEFVADIPTGPSHPTWATLERIERRLPELASLPIRLVWGMRDWCFNPECLDRFLRHWPAADAVRLEDVGHWVVEDAPDDSLRLLSEFVARSSTVTSR